MAKIKLFFLYLYSYTMSLRDIYLQFKNKNCSSNKKSHTEFGKDELIVLCKYLNLNFSINL